LLIFEHLRANERSERVQRARCCGPRVVLWRLVHPWGHKHSVVRRNAAGGRRCATHEASYPMRHVIPHGTEFHAAWHRTQHGIQPGTVSPPACYDVRASVWPSVRVDSPREGKHAARGFSGIPLTRALEGIRTLTGAGEGDLVVVTVNYRLVRGAGRSVACLFLLLSLLRIRPFACLLAWVVCLLGSLLFLVPALIPLCITSHPEPSENSEPSEKSLGTPAGY
jgi:hypothetical protein